jgi:thiosulfate/3-mercaptopyruvate sulfurtransferase
VIYGSRGTWNPYFGRYTLRFFGGTRASVFHEGIEGWSAAGLTVETAASKATPVKLKLAPSAGVSVSTTDMISRPKSSGVQIIDARTPKEFAGEDIRALRGGHIPGAVNVPWVLSVNDDGTFKSVKELEKLYLKDSSLKRRSPTLAYCRIGERSSLTWFVLKYLLGFSNVRNYDGSWMEWGNCVGVPVVKGTEPSGGSQPHGIADDAEVAVPPAPVHA